MKHRVVALVLACACGPQVASMDGGDTSGADDAPPPPPTTTETPTSDAPTSGAPTSDAPTSDAPDTGGTDPMATTSGATTSSEVEEGAEENAFVSADDVGIDGTMCDPWAQDCPRGEKCLPWANDGGHSWNATHCSPVADDPQADGESCTAFDGPFGGNDDCAVGSMCFWVDERTNFGECVAMCIGSLDRPSCADGITPCTLSSDGLPAVCLPVCDPIEQDCSEGSGCYFVHDRFECDPDVSGVTGAPGDACDAAGACDPGAVCVLGTAVPDCATQTCCAAFCDLTAPSCADGLECIAWHDDGEAPPGEEDVGACLIQEDG
jgi:hypothetical protein